MVLASTLCAGVASAAQDPAPRCEEALAKAEAAPERAWQRAVGDAFERCWRLIRHGECRDVYRTLPHLPRHERVAAIVETCARAYCHRLAPKPAACTAAAARDPELQARQAELLSAVLARDQPLIGRERLEAIVGRLLALLRDAHGVRELTLSLTDQAPDATLELSLHGLTWRAGARSRSLRARTASGAQLPAPEEGLPVALTLPTALESPPLPEALSLFVGPRELALAPPGQQPEVLGSLRRGRGDLSGALARLKAVAESLGGACAANLYVDRSLPAQTSVPLLVALADAGCRRLRVVAREGLGAHDQRIQDLSGLEKMLRGEAGAGAVALHAADDTPWEMWVRAAWVLTVDFSGAPLYDSFGAPSPKGLFDHLGARPRAKVGPRFERVRVVPSGAD